MAKAKNNAGSVLDLVGELTGGDTPSSFDAAGVVLDAAAGIGVAANGSVVAVHPRARLDEIERDVNQPRKEIDEEDLHDKAESMKMVGVLQPIVLRETNFEAPYTKRFVLVSGEERWRAADIAGLVDIPYVLRNDLPVENVFLAQTIENTNRKDLSDWNLALAIRQILDSPVVMPDGTRKKLKQNEVGRLVSRSKSTISKVLGMLDDDVVQLCEEKIIRTSSDCSLFKALSDEEKVILVEKVRSEGRAISRPDFDQLKATSTAAGTGGQIEGDNLQSQHHEDGQVDGDGASSDGAAEAAGTGDSIGSNDAYGANSDFGGAGELGGETGTLGTMTNFDGGSNTPASSSSGSSSGSSESSGEKSKNVSIKLKVEDVERLIPFFVDKAEDKMEIRFSADLAIALIENMKGTVPDDPTDYADKIRELLA